MDSMSRYIARLSDPALLSFNRSLRDISPEDPEPARSNVTLEHIAAAEQALGVTLPPGYRTLVQSAQPFEVEYGLYWTWDGEADLFTEDIVSVNRGENARIPPFLIAVMGSDVGDEYCFDTRFADERGEYPIVLLDHEIHNEDDTEFKVVARDLGEFLLGSLP